MNPYIILTAQAMRAAENAAIAAGVAGASLMEKAGEETARLAMRAWTMRPVAVMCGPGNNGGDGFVAARILAAAGWPVRVGLIGEAGKLTGDAKLMAELYEGGTEPFQPGVLDDAGLIIDAIFGTGLARPVEGRARTAIEAMNAHPAPVLSVDLPSGVDADTGGVLAASATSPGVAIRAARTITFHARKPGHVLLPGRALCGAVDVVDIGIGDQPQADTPSQTFENHPALWGGLFPRPGWTAHKYHRGAVMAVSGGPLNTGAARLAAMGALRIGAGAVTLLSPADAAQVNASHLTAIMLRVADSAEEIAEAMEAARRMRLATVIGPGVGLGAATREKVLAILKSKAGAVLDADALTSFADMAQDLFTALRPDDVLTPHMGEFERLFPAIAADAQGKLAAARAASRKAGCVVVLKGADTVIAAPDGRALVNVNAPPDLATAGSGDVLAGFIAGLMVQGMDGFAAAAAGVWFHGAAGQTVGPGLIAEDLPGAAPAVLRSLFAPPQQANTPPDMAQNMSDGGAQQ